MPQAETRTRLCVSKRLEDFLLLLKERPRTRLELMNMGLGGSTIKKLVDELKKWGVVEEYVEGKKVYVRLTAKGEKLVEKLREIYELLES